MPRLLESIARAIRYHCASCAECVAPVSLHERQQPLHITFVFHVEQVAYGEVFGPFVDFVRWVRAETGCAATVCVTTPHCPMTAAEMSLFHLTEAEYEARIGLLAEAAEVGYHGHFYQRHASLGAARERSQELLGMDADGPRERLMWEQCLSPISPDSFDAAAVGGQMAAELEWLRARFGQVLTYVAGWWLLSEELVGLMEDAGIEADCSIRRGHSNTFGSRYWPEQSRPPRGEPAILPPSRRIVEIQSGFYPVDHPRRTKRLLAPTLAHKPEQPLFLALPSHEGETLEWGDVFKDNVRMLLRQAPSVRWTPLGEQLPLARAAIRGMT